MRVKFTDINLWYPQWNQMIPFRFYWPLSKKVSGDGYSFNIMDYSTWCFKLPDGRIAQMSDCDIEIKGRKVTNLYSMFKLLDGKVQYNCMVSNEDGVTVDIVQADEVYFIGDAWDIDGNDIE
jgi:hypothetical protein